MQELTEEHLEKAAQVYAQGLLLEEPPGSTEPLETLTQHMEEHLQEHLERKETRHIWVASIEKNIRGLLDFYLEGENIQIRFICAIPPRRGVGTQLMRHLARFAQIRKVSRIQSTVSSLDHRAMKFYFDHLRFGKIGRRLEESGFELYIVAIALQKLLRVTERGVKKKKGRMNPYHFKSGTGSK